MSGSSHSHLSVNTLSFPLSVRPCQTMHPQSHKALMVNMFSHSFVMCLVCARACVLPWYGDNEIHGKLSRHIICSLSPDLDYFKSLMESKYWHKRYVIKARISSFSNIKHLLLVLRSVGARVQSDWRVLQEALSDWSAATRTGAGTPGRAGPETLGLVHPEDSNGQTLSGCTLCHQGSHYTCLHGMRTVSLQLTVETMSY